MQHALLAVAVLAASLGSAGASSSAPPALRLDNIRLLVDHFDESFRFYRDLIGLQPTWGKEGENYASFVFPGGGQIALFRRSLMTDAIGAAAAPLSAGGPDTVALVLYVDDVDAAYAALKARGAAFVAPPVDQPVWGIRTAHFRDPDGHLLEIFAPLRK